MFVKYLKVDYKLLSVYPIPTTVTCIDMLRNLNSGHDQNAFFLSSLYTVLQISRNYDGLGYFVDIHDIQGSESFGFNDFGSKICIYNFLQRLYDGLIKLN